jgi:hypothetical protein
LKTAYKQYTLITIQITYKQTNNNTIYTIHIPNNTIHKIQTYKHTNIHTYKGELKRICRPALGLLRWLVTHESEAEDGNVWYTPITHLLHTYYTPITHLLHT